MSNVSIAKPCLCSAPCLYLEMLHYWSVEDWREFQDLVSVVTIVNISSIGGQMTFPLGTLYHGTKFAVEGLSEALHYELEPFGVKVKIVEPGMIRTDFGGRSFDLVNDETMAEYQGTVQKFFAYINSAGENMSEPEVVAEVIWTAVTDGTNTLRYRAGNDAVALLDHRKAQDDEHFISHLKQQMGL